MSSLDSKRTTQILAILFVILSILTIYQIWDATRTKADLETLTSRLTELCRKGAIDCRGTQGLPGSEGNPGTGIQSVACDPKTREFVVTYTNKTQVFVGDCFAEKGSKGDKGDVGATGPRGLSGHNGAPGIGISSVICDSSSQHFVVTYTNGRKTSMGDCVADTGPRGLRGPAGPQGTLPPFKLPKIPKPKLPPLL